MASARRGRAAILRTLGEPLAIEEIDVPPPGPGQVRVRVHIAGVCHTQLQEARGWRGDDAYLPHALGHEGAGMVDAVGAGVAKVRPGDRVILSWLRGPGLDPPPAGYGGATGRLNAGRVTTFQEWTIVPESRATPMAEDIPFDVAALVGCAIATGAGAVLNTAAISPGSRVAVFGVGGVGLAAVQGARLAGALLIAAIDVRPARLALAGALGATHVFDASVSPPDAWLREITDGQGVDVAIEAAGRPEAMEGAFRAIRTGGGLAVLAGNAPHGSRIAIDPFHLILGKRLVGSWGGDTSPDRDFPRLLEWYREGRLDVAAMISHRFPLEQVNDALDALERGDVTRAILEC